MQALEDLCVRVRSTRSRRYVDEAVAAYTAGAYRSAIIAVWIAITADLIEKVRVLADEGVGAAVALDRQLGTALEAETPKQMQAFERGLLEAARDKLHLIGAREFTELSRIREDRHLCAHPAFVSEDDELFSPTAELVRSHLAAAVGDLLAHGAVSGRKAIERFRLEVGEYSFPKDDGSLVGYLRESYWTRGTSSLRRNLVQVAAKETLNPDHDLNLRWQFTRALRAADQLAPAVVEEGVSAVLQRRQDGLDDEGLMRLAAGLCYLPCTWEQLHEGVRNRLIELITSVPIIELAACELFDPLPQNPLASEVCKRLGDAVSWSEPMRATPLFGSPDARLVGPLIDLLAEADTFMFGAATLRWINGLVLCLDAEAIRRIVTAACENDQIYGSVLSFQQMAQLRGATIKFGELPEWRRWDEVAAGE